MELTGIIEDMSIDYKSGKPKVSFILNERECLNQLEKIKDGKLYIKVDKKRNKRSLDSNAYMWKIADKIASKIGITKLEVYRDAIKEVGQFEIVPIKDEAVENFIRAWKHNGQGWICEIIGKSKIKGYTNVTAYYGSSVYDSKAMSRLIDLIVQEAKQLDIETLPPNEIESLKNSWGER